ncbi:GtrA family protein [uncultured Lamprocystis sp.]|jgi:putative flippase GtrA|uniref:GtrA family protein n=1 Tax=uncultured Lamprocystis sp. TaxID=543132 RepID=UPI0025FD579F|nr:GtrA family protein [uncultured Lamprocystis sp.]
MFKSITTILHRVATFGIVGAIGTLVHYSALVLLVEIGLLDAVAATTVGFALGAIVNYLLNYRYTFNSTKQHRDSGPKFALIAIATGLLNTLVVHAGVDSLRFNYLLVQVVATGIVFLLNFILNSVWTFHESDAL